MNKFAAMGWFKTAEEDIFAEGCVGKAAIDGGHQTFTAPTLEKLIEQCADFVGQEDLTNCLLDSCEEAGRLDIQVYECEDGSPASNNEMQQWKEGKQRVWLATYTFNLLRVEKLLLSRNVSNKLLYATV